MNKLNDKCFYSNEERKYFIKENKKFLDWYKEELNSGYSYILELEEVEDLINKIVIWYQLKYPNRKLEKGLIDTRFEDLKDITKELTIDQLRYRLSSRQIEALDCNYRSGSGGVIPIGGYYDDDNILCDVDTFRTVIHLHLSSKEKDLTLDHTIIADTKGNLIDSSDLEKYIGNKKVNTLDELFDVLRESENYNIDYSNLKKCVLTHMIDKTLREKIINIAALNLFFAQEVDSNYSYFRAKRLIKEFNDYYKLNISTQKMDLFVVCRTLNNRLYEDFNNFKKIEEEPLNKEKAKVKLNKIFKR